MKIRWGRLGRRGRALILLTAAASASAGVGVSKLQSGTAAQSSAELSRAVRGDLLSTVGGVGRIVQARGPASVSVPVSSANAASSSASATTLPAGAVFARASGRIARLYVAPGQRVAAGTPIAAIDDGGGAAAAVKQTNNDLLVALVELQQKRTSDPLRGLPPTRSELAAARAAVSAARQRLARVLGRPRRADVSAAELDVKRAQADLQVLLGGTTAERARALALARQDEDVAQKKLDRILAPASAAAVAAATLDVRKAEAELAALLAPAAKPRAETIAAAQQAVDTARIKLATLQSTPGASADDIATAKLDLARAIADLAELTKPQAGPLPEVVAAAQAAVEAARLKLSELLAPPNAADVAAARADLARAHAAVTRLLAGPSAVTLGAARQAVLTARAKLAQLLGPPLRADVTAARLDVRRAEADLAVLRARGGPASPADIRVARLKVAAARTHLAVTRFAERRLTVVAPAAGTVTDVLTVRGAPTDATTPVAAVTDLSHLSAVVALSEFDAARVKRGMRAIVRVDALGGKAFAGKVLFAALTGTENGGVVTFPVRVSLDRARGLKPGMNVSVRIVVAQRRGVVQVPLEAVSHDAEDHSVVRVRKSSGRVSLRWVHLGLSNNKSVQVVKGVRAGELVYLAASQGGGGEED